MSSRNAVRGPRRQRGLSLVEVVIAAGIGAAVLGASISAMDASSKVERSSSRSATVIRRADHCFAPIVDALRRSSFASVRTVADEALVEGTPVTAFRLQPVIGWTDSPLLGDTVEYLWIDDGSGTTGDLVARTNGTDRVLARGLSQFQVERQANTFVVRVTTTVGPADDSARSLSAAVAVAPRNP